RREAGSSAASRGIRRRAGQRRDGGRADDHQGGQEEDRAVAPREVEHEPTGVRAEGARAVMEQVRDAEDGAVVSGSEELADQRRGEGRGREERRSEQRGEQVKLPRLAREREVEERRRSD